MSQRSQNKRSAGIAGVKALIASASVAATIAGWALLPANDPAAAAGTVGPTDQLNQPPALSMPGDNSFQQPDTSQSTPSSPNSELPQVQAPQGSSRFPFTRTHSSR